MSSNRDDGTLACVVGSATDCAPLHFSRFKERGTSEKKIKNPVLHINSWSVVSFDSLVLHSPNSRESLASSWSRARPGQTSRKHKWRTERGRWGRFSKAEIQVTRKDIAACGQVLVSKSTSPQHDARTMMIRFSILYRKFIAGIIFPRVDWGSTCLTICGISLMCSFTRRKPHYPQEDGPKAAWKMSQEKHAASIPQNRK